MQPANFFEGERQKFFRPLNSSRRELIVACLRALYERLHGPSADYSHNLTREMLRDLLLPVVREHQDKLAPDSVEDEFNSPDTAEPPQLTTVVIRALLADGWLEQFADRTGLVIAFRLSRTGKLFSEALWSLDRPSRSRQRNMRSCRNALEAALSERGDANDLVDAYEYAEKVIEDLTDGIDYFQELVRNLMQAASVHTQWSEFVEFLDRFQRDYSRQLTADNATLNRQAIRQKLEKLRCVPDAKFKRMNGMLLDIPWVVKDQSGPTAYDWMLDRIESIVDAACESKQPGFLKAMETYMKRVNGLALQSMMMRASQNRHAYLSAIQRISESSPDQQDKLLSAIGQQLAAVEVRLLDPSIAKVRTRIARRKAQTVSIQARPTRESRLAAAMNRAETEAFSLSNEEIASVLRAEVRLFGRPTRLSAQPTTTAREVLSVMQAVEAIRTSGGSDLVVRKLPTRLDNSVYSGSDYEIDLKK